MTLIRARSRDKTLEGNTFKKLKKRPEIVKELMEDLEKVVAFFHSLNIEIIPVDSRLLFQSLDITKEYGLFGNDTITVLVMRRRNMKYILSSDKDFDGVGWIKRIDALQGCSGK
ncbi:type II toxin-antitoxin system VapC family toxin [Desulfurobacterium sp.]|uniref:type II toxin-antitoxin system VapC family toxin n=1 Tax=Desulfurobacterium sp. TaxID=2004706 RepID=UPI0026176713|nr:type II toxin-antitoxin system VapC family toxin [Desulfurobacterium sp.]